MRAILTVDQDGAQVGQAQLVLSSPRKGSNVIEDVVEIEQVLYRYCHAVDRGSPDEVAALFHERGTLVPIYSGEEPRHGRPAIREWYATYNRDFRARVKHLRHCVASPAIEVSGSEASARTYLIADYVLESTGKPAIVAGFYEDRFVKDAGRWYFAERRIHVFHAMEPPKAAESVPGR
jgi:SnoaL-like protein